jgi:hypothetical protein
MRSKIDLSPSSSTDSAVTSNENLPASEAKPTKRATNGRTLVLGLLLVVGVFAAYSPQLAPALWGRVESPADTLTYIADLDYWQRTDREIQIVANARFDLDSQLTNVPLVLGDWRGEEVPESNQEVIILLDPEQYVQRLYQNSQGHYMWLSMIGGRSSQPFHAPDICYDADGWQYNLSSKAIALEDGGEVHGLWMEANKIFPGQSEKTEHIVFYFYLFPNQSRELKDGIVLFKLTSSRYGTPEETLELHADFVRQLFKRAQAPGV